MPAALYLATSDPITKMGSLTCVCACVFVFAPVHACICICTVGGAGTNAHALTHACVMCM